MPFNRGNRVLLRRVLLLLVILLGMGVILSGCYGRSQPKGWSGATVAGDGIFVGSLDGRLVSFNKAYGSPLWSDDGEAGILGTAESKVAIYGTPAVAGDLVYVAGYNGKIYAFVLSTGALRWVYPREDNLEPIVSGVVEAQGKVYFGCSDGKVYALDAATGDKAWSFETGGKIWSTPATDGDTLYVTSFDKKLYALNASDGSKTWEFEIETNSITTPLVYENVVYIGSFGRYFYAIDAGAGSLRWQSEVEGGKWFWAKAVAHDNVIYAPNLDGKVYILSAENGSEVAGAIDLGNPISSDPVVVGGKVIIATEEGKMYALDTVNHQHDKLFDVTIKHGDIPEKIDRKIYAPLSADNGVVYIKAQTSSEDALYAVNIETQVTMWSQSLVISSEGD
ncbi:PQQ-binding-like beta-propeller repeat protein [Chloroflexota bacterium]